MSCLKSLFQSEAKCEAIDLEMISFSFPMQIKLICPTKLLYLASVVFSDKQLEIGQLHTR